MIQNSSPNSHIINSPHDKAHQPLCIVIIVSGNAHMASKILPTHPHLL